MSASQSPSPATTTPTHPRPLASTVETGGLARVAPRAVYASAELLTYCLLMQQAGQTSSAAALYEQYLGDPRVVVVESATLRASAPPAPAPAAAATQQAWTPQQWLQSLGLRSEGGPEGE